VTGVLDTIPTGPALIVLSVYHSMSGVAYDVPATPVKVDLSVSRVNLYLIRNKKQ